MSRVIGDRSKTAPQPYGIGVGEEYADGDRQTPMMTSRLTGARQTPTDAGSVSTAAEGPFFHAANGSKTRPARAAVVDQGVALARLAVARVIRGERRPGG